jgi:tetratricopeptide (TPR) repeat protein
MKRTERHHLKENELANVAASARATFEERGGQLKLVAVVIAAVLVLGIGYAVWSSRTQGRAGILLAEAMAVQDARVGAPEGPGSRSSGPTFPNEREKNQAMLAKFKAVADQFPDSDEGIFARYREGGVHMALASPKDAASSYEQVIAKAGDSLYGQMARMGLAEAHARSGEFDKAIDAYKDLSTRKDGPLPIDGVLMQLGRLYRTAGKPADAEQTFNRLVNEFPDSQFAADAKRELDVMKQS